jgi:hypothetical protein
MGCQLAAANDAVNVLRAWTGGEADRLIRKRAEKEAKAREKAYRKSAR